MAKTDVKANVDMYAPDGAILWRRWAPRAISISLAEPA
jgi:hypothetical protein